MPILNKIEYTMEYMPNEILSHIFSYSSKRSNIECSKVCKKWYQLILTPKYYSTIHVYTIDQYSKFLQLANNIDNIRLINNKPVRYYVYYLHIHKFELSMNDISILFSMFPNIRDIKGISVYETKAIPNILHILETQLQHLNYMPSWYRNIDWMDYINNKFTSLDLDINVLMEIKNQRNQQERKLSNPLSLFNQFDIKKMDKENIKAMCFNDIRVNPMVLGEEEENQPAYVLTTYNSKIIMLPILNRLTTLSITFLDTEQYYNTIYEFDERTFESIHQSCPILEHLEMHRLNMNISEDYDQILSKLKSVKRSTIGKTSNLPSSILANNLKHFCLINGVIHDPRCYTYFLNKYPQLESLNLKLEWYHSHNVQINIPFKLALFDLITQSFCLKSLEFDLNHFFNFQQIDFNEQYWPTVEFSAWLKTHPNQLTFLKYPYDIKTINENVGEIEEMDTSKSDDEIYLSLTTIYSIEQVNYLNHLKHLSINITEFIQSTYSYLTLNNDRQIASLSIEELEIKIDYIMRDDTHSFYIYSWLDAFPNLLNLTLMKTTLIKDVPSKTNHLYVNNLRMKNEPSGKIIYVTDIMKKEIKEKGRIVNDNGLNDNSDGVDDDNGQHKTYKLKELNIQHSTIYFKNGFSSFSKKCPHITKLVLQDVDYGMVDWKISKYQQFIAARVKENSGKIEKDIFYQAKKKTKEYHIIETTFDLSSMDHLDYLSIVNFKYIPWIGENHEDQPIIKNLNIQETCYLKKKYKVKPTKQGVALLFERIFSPAPVVHDKTNIPYALNILCKSILDINFG